MGGLQKLCLTCKRELPADAIVCPDDGGQAIPVMKDPLVGKLFADKYEVLDVLGSGGMSIIYKARHQYMDRICALKLLHPFLGSSSSMFQRFQQEAKAASNLSHPNVVGIHDFGITDDSRAYLVMDYLEGEDLASVLEREVYLNEAVTLELMRQTLLGLDHAHSKGLVHRDLKPSNLFLVRTQEDTILVKIVDFGIAKMIDSQSNSGQNITRTGEVFGSPLYMSPEQCAGKPLDARSDIYSLGCLFYETLCGQSPISGETAMETMQMHLQTKPRRIGEVAPLVVVSQKTEEVIMRCMEKRAQDRFDSAAAIYEALFDEPLPKLALTGHPRNTGHSIEKLNPPDMTVLTNKLNVTKRGLTPATPVDLENTELSEPRAGKNTSKLQQAMTQHKKKISFAMGITLAPICIAVIGVIVFWPGPENDRGTILNRWIYTIYLAQGESLTKDKNFQEAEKSLLLAETYARKFSDNSGRLVNVLNSEASLYSVWNQPSKLEETTGKLTQITKTRAYRDFRRIMEELNNITRDRNKSDNSFTKQKELEARVSAVTEGIINISRRLALVKAFDDQERLLTRAINLCKQCDNSDSPPLAKLITELAECHIQQGEFDEVRPLLQKAKEILTAAVDRKVAGADKISLASAWLKLGQFDRDRSNYASSQAELKEAFTILQNYKTLDPKVPDNLKGHQVYIECLYAQADLTDQQGMKEEAKKLLEEAKALKNQLPQQMP
jgi:serine/threonine-protein kinase